VSKVQNDHPAPLTHLNPKSVGSTDCRGLLLCQVSSHSDQGFSFYRANMHTHHRRQPRRGCRGRIPTNILVGGDINGNVPTNIRGGSVVEYELLIASVKIKQR